MRAGRHVSGLTAGSWVVTCYGVHVALTRRTQILLDDERHDALQRRSAETGESVGELIRRAIDQLYAGQEDRDRAAAEGRERALARFLAAPPLPVGEWADVEQELETLYERGLGESE